MTTIRQDDFVQSIADALQFISYYHPLDYIQAPGKAYEREQSPAARDAIAQILTNSRMSAQGHRPICQDTGIVTTFVKIGMDVRWDGASMSVSDMINEGVRRAYLHPDNMLRASVLADPAGARKNNPIIRLPDRARVEGIPEGWVPGDAAGQALEANFVKIAVNVMRRPGSEENVLPELLRGWFGAEAGSPGTRHLVEFSQRGGAWSLTPAGQGSTGFTLWKSYPRQEVAERFGHDYSRNWGQGVVWRGNEFYFFVTLEKEDLPSEHRYKDRFLSRDVFEWQSQNRTRRDSETGRAFRDHVRFYLKWNSSVKKG